MFQKYIKKLDKKKIVFLIIFLVILSAGIFLRFWKIGEIPPGLHYNEAQNGLLAIESGPQIIYPENQARGNFYLNSLSFSLDLFGANIKALRSVSAFFGILTIVGFFLLLNKLRFSKSSILLGIFLLTFSFWHLNFSHLVYSSILVPFFLVWTLFLLISGMGRNNYWLFLAAGFLLGIGLHSYFSFWFIPLILFILLSFFLFFQKDFFIQHRQPLLLFFLAFFLATVPLFVYNFQQRLNPLLPLGEATLFNSPDLDFWQSAGESLKNNFVGFFYNGDPNQRHIHASSSLFPTTWAIFFVFGFLFSFKEIFRTFKNRKAGRPPTRSFRASVLAHAIFWPMILPGILAPEGAPHMQKLIGILPAVFIFMLLPFEYIATLWLRVFYSENLQYKPWRFRMITLSLTGLILITFLTGLTQIYSYFGVWAKEPETLLSFDRKQYEFGKAVMDTETKKNSYMLIPSDISIEMNDNSSEFKTVEFVAHEKLGAFQFAHPIETLSKIEDCQDSIFIFYDADQWLVDRFQQKCPKATAQEKQLPNGFYKFWFIKG